MKLKFIMADNKVVEFVECPDQATGAVPYSLRPAANYIREPGEATIWDCSAKLAVWEGWDLRPKAPLIPAGNGIFSIRGTGISTMRQIEAPQDAVPESPEGRAVYQARADMKNAGAWEIIDIPIEEIEGRVEDRLLFTAGGRKYQAIVDIGNPATSATILRKLPGTRDLDPGVLGIGPQDGQSFSHRQTVSRIFYSIFLVCGFAFVSWVLAVALLRLPLVWLTVAVAFALAVVYAYRRLGNVLNGVRIDASGVCFLSGKGTRHIPYDGIERLSPQKRMSKRVGIEGLFAPRESWGVLVKTKKGEELFVDATTEESMLISLYFQARAPPQTLSDHRLAVEADATEERRRLLGEAAKAWGEASRTTAMMNYIGPISCAASITGALLWYWAELLGERGTHGLIWLFVGSMWGLFILSSALQTMSWRSHRRIAGRFWDIFGQITEFNIAQGHDRTGVPQIDGRQLDAAANAGFRMVDASIRSSLVSMTLSLVVLILIFYASLSRGSSELIAGMVFLMVVSAAVVQYFHLRGRRNP